MSSNYFRPKILKEALDLKQKDPSAKFIGGGSTLQKETRECTLIDLQLLPFREIETNNGSINVGSLVSLEIIRQYFKDFPELVLALKIEGSKNQRNQSSLGGFIKKANGRSPFLTCLTAMDVYVKTEPGMQRINLIDFLKNRDNLKDLIVGIEIKIPDMLRFESIGRSPMDKPVVCCAQGFYKQNQKISFGGFGKYPMVVDTKDVKTQKPDTISNLLIEDDAWASAEYRKEMIDVLLKRMTIR